VSFVDFKQFLPLGLNLPISDHISRVAQAPMLSLHIYTLTRFVLPRPPDIAIAIRIRVSGVKQYYYYYYSYNFCP
jgi:H+/gluconate symporter-like permease